MRRGGADVTIVAGEIVVHRALEAAERLATEGIQAEVIDLRSIRPIDHAAILESVRKTGRLLVVYEGVKSYGVGAEISAMVAKSDAFDFLDAPIVRRRSRPKLCQSETKARQLDSASAAHGPRRVWRRFASLKRRIAMTATERAQTHATRPLPPSQASIVNV